ncbi:hypothetical protein DL96DRAFT_1598540 [Flagelloscypha sp. PMI_526]|nr:hypothetical protein DL96DRAFT_1598540 [Flagelloscypha sp. PMI_526]
MLSASSALKRTVGSLKTTLTPNVSTWSQSPVFVRGNQTMATEMPKPKAPKLAAQPVSPRPKTLHYFVPRNANGNLPVYSDIRNGGTRNLVLVRNVQGQLQKLTSELRVVLCEGDHQPGPTRPKFQADIVNGTTLRITGGGGLWARQVMEYLTKKGF